MVVAGELLREPHNAPLHLFSARAALIEFGKRAYRLHSDQANQLLRQLFEGFQREGLSMPFTMEDFNRQFTKEHFAQLTSEEQAEALKKLPVDRLLAILPPEVRQTLEQPGSKKPAPPRKPRRKK